MQTALLVTSQTLLAEDFTVETYRDDRNNNCSHLVSKETKEIDGVYYRGTSSEVYGKYNTAEEFLQANSVHRCYIHSVRMEHIGEAVQWAAETFYSQTVEVSL